MILPAVKVLQAILPEEREPQRIVDALPIFTANDGRKSTVYQDTKNSSVRAKSDPGLSSLRTSDIVAKKICDPPSRQGVTSDSTRRKRATTHRGHSPHLHGKRWSKVNSLSGHQEQLSKGKVRSRFVFTSHVRHRSEENK